MQRAAIYARVSTDDQAKEGYSLDAQRDMLNAYCESQELEISGTYVDDGYSGRNTNRPEYKRMMNDIDAWDIIIVIKMDRIHRNSKNFMEMMEFLEKRNKKFASSTESLDTTNALGRFVVDMIQRIAQLESEQIGERTYMGMREKAESSAGILGFTPPFGYSLKSGQLISCEDELKYVRFIFSLYKDGLTLERISQTLNESGNLTRRSNKWNKYNVRNVLHNTIYAGFMEWDGVFVQHHADAPLSAEEFDDIQKMMASRSRRPLKNDIKCLTNCAV